MGDSAPEIKHRRAEPFRTIVRDPKAARWIIERVLLPRIDRQLHEGRVLRLSLDDAADVVQTGQRNYLHGVVLRRIAQEPVGAGMRRYPMEVWKEFFRDHFLGERVVSVTNPITGESFGKSVRVSSEDLGVRGYARYTEQIKSYAAVEWGMEFPAMSETIDPETGEILGGY